MSLTSAFDSRLIYGQYSYVAGFGLLFYNARWYDPALGRFAQADSIIPDAGDPLSFDRYSYVRDNPMNRVDPSGHNWRCGPDGEYCGYTDPPKPRTIGACHLLDSDGGGYCLTNFSPDYYDDAIAAGFGYALSQGQWFVYWLQQNTGWWSKYMTTMEEMWKFLIALVYAYESGGTWDVDWENKTWHKLLPQAFANKMGYLVDTYGTAGYYIFLGSMQAVRERIGDAQAGILDKPVMLEKAFEKTAGIWDGSLRSSDPNAPYDFANPMPGKHPQELLDRLTAYTEGCRDRARGCSTTGLDGTLYVLASWVNGKWEIAFIVSYTQMTWK